MSSRLVAFVSIAGAASLPKAKRNLGRAADAFDMHGMIGLFRPDLRTTRGSSPFTSGCDAPAEM